MKHKIKMRVLTPAEKAELEQMKKELIGHRPEDYSSYNEYFRNEIIIPTENFFKKNA